METVRRRADGLFPGGEGSGLDAAWYLLDTFIYLPVLFGTAN